MNTISTYNPSFLLSNNLEKINPHFTSRWDLHSQPAQDIFQRVQPQPKEAEIQFAGKDGEEDVYYINGQETRVNAGTRHNTVSQSVNNNKSINFYA
ncbi:MAG: hypothetical protein AB7V50_06200 [Vampirovibrionia bacterium]